MGSLNRTYDTEEQAVSDQSDSDVCSTFTDNEEGKLSGCESNILGSRACKRIHSSVPSASEHRRPQKTRLESRVNLLDEDDLIDLRDHTPPVNSYSQELERELCQRCDGQRLSSVTERSLALPDASNKSAITRWSQDSVESKKGISQDYEASLACDVTIARPLEAPDSPSKVNCLPQGRGSPRFHELHGKDALRIPKYVTIGGFGLNGPDYVRTTWAASDESGLIGMSEIGRNASSDKQAKRPSSIEPVFPRCSKRSQVPNDFDASAPMHPPRHTSDFVEAAASGDCEKARHWLLQLPKINSMVLAEAFFSASSNGHVDIIEMLLIRGLDVNFQFSKEVEIYNKTHRDLTPLHLAAASNRCTTIELLLRCGAEVQSRDSLEWTPLHLASARGCVSAVRVLLEHQAPLEAKCCLAAADVSDKNMDVNGSSRAGGLLEPISWTPLFVSTMLGASETVKCLIECGANIEEVPAFGFSLLHAASLGNFRNIFLGLVEDSEDMSALIKIQDLPMLPKCAVQPAGHSALLEYLLTRGVNPSTPDALGLTPLHLACLHNVDIARTLIDHNADVSARSKLGWTPLHIAVLWESDPSLAQLLIETGADLEMPLILPRATRTERSCCEVDNLLTRWLTPLGLAVAKGNHSLVRCLLQMGARTQMSDPARSNVLSIAAAMGSTSMFILLSKQGINHWIPEVQGMSMVDFTASHQTRSSQLAIKRLSQAEKEGQLIEETVRSSHDDRLLTFQDYLPKSFRINIDTCDQHGNTPLLKAIRGISNEIVRLAVIVRFLDLGASTRIPDQDGKHVLHFSDKLQNEEIRRLFIADADLEARDNLGRTPLLHLVRMSKQITKVEYLIALGANIYAKDNQGRTAWTLLAEASDRQSKAKIGRLSLSFSDLSEDNQKGELKKILNKVKKSRPPPRDWEE